MKALLTLLVSMMIVLTACATDSEEQTGDDTDTEPGEEAVGDDVDGNDEDEEGETEEVDAPQVSDFELEISFNEGGEWSYEYERDGDSVEADMDQEGGPEQEGEDLDAEEEIERILSEANFTPDMPEEEAMNAVYNALDISEGDLDEFDLQIEFDDGSTLDVEESF
ncbi:YusW family protein [Halalkalibacillus halophilus]|uniref:YusW family protein n=1 Tax=Halalkalibacillus halophilus TaxID=392827 RepID=UPI00042502C6|nr:YusW family protein [Halalkalibacillus halophilus]